MRKPKKKGDEKASPEGWPIIVSRSADGKQVTRRIDEPDPERKKVPSRPFQSPAARFRHLWSDENRVASDTSYADILKKEIDSAEQNKVSRQRMVSSDEELILYNFMNYAAMAAKEFPHAQNLDQVIGSFLRAHFAKVRAQSLPPIPERKYVPRQDEIIPFLREVWSDWLAGGHLQRQILHDNDPDAYSALSNWLRNNKLPDDMDIPTNREVTDRELENEWFHRDDVPRIASAMARRARFPR